MKKALFVLIAVFLLMFCFAVSASASTVDSGACGENLTWTLDSDGELTISGAGKMYYYSEGFDSENQMYYTTAPWGGAVPNSERIKALVIENGVTSIGSYAFSGCTGLTGISLPNSVKSIDSYAFSNCTGLENITIPESVTSIEAFAFRNCVSLSNVIIPESVIYIGWGPFSGCSGLTSITIPFIGARKSRDLGSYQYPFGYIFGTEEYRGGTEAHQYYYGSNSSSKVYLTFIIPSSLKSVTLTGGRLCKGAFFNCDELTTVTLPNSVKSIEYEAFYGCSQLTSVTIPDGVTSIGGYAFSGCFYLRGIKIPEGVTLIGGSAFSDCSRLRGVLIPKSVTSIGKDAFIKYKTELYYCGSKQDWTIISNPSGYIPDEYNCCLENGVVYNENKTVAIKAISPISITEVVLPDTVGTVRSNAFADCTLLKTVTIPVSVKSICDGAFKNCNALTDVYYGGTQEDWADAVNFGLDNQCIMNANIRFHTHDYIVDTILVPTCISAGEEFCRCRECGFTCTRILEGLGHDYVYHEGKVPTCTEAGWEAYQTCSRCDYTTYKALPAPGHSWGAWTGVNETQHSRVCANDPMHVETENHVWNEGEVTKPATATENGERTFTCTVCGATRTEIIQKPAVTPENIGDINGDGEITSADARLALRAAVGLEEYEGFTADVADANRDGEITSADARLLLRAAVGLEDPVNWFKT